jgi:hypothetical protein
MDITWGILSTLLGVGLIVLTLVDVFTTVLSPGSGHGPVRRPLARGLRTTFRLSRHLRLGRRHRVLTYLGPSEVTLTLVAWFALPLVGWAAIYRPALGAGVVAAQGATDQSWGTALYFSGYNLTTLGLGDLVATDPVFRVLVVLEAATGFMTITLAISYFISIYGTLTRRNTFAMALHDRSGGTGDGARVVQALWTEGPNAAAAHLTSMAEDLRVLAQTHHAYPVLRAFHYRRDYEALPWILLTCWETATLLRTTVAAGPERPELSSSAVAEMVAAAGRVTAPLDARPWSDTGPDREPAWHVHHAELVARLNGVPVRPDAAERYVEARRAWDPALAALAHELLYDWSDTLPPEPGFRTSGGSPSRG